MTLSERMYLLTPAGEIRRLPSALFSQMLRAPLQHPLMAVANRRLRAAEIIVELANRKPVRVIRGYFFYIGFDHRGVMDAYALLQEAASNISAIRSDSQFGDNVRAAPSGFPAPGRRWMPSSIERTALDESALGMRSVPYLRTLEKHK